MKTFLVAAMVVASCNACSSTNYPDSSRIAADMDCLAQLALDGVQVYAAKGVPSAKDTADAINKAATMTDAAADKCARTLKYAGQDVNDIKARIDAKKGK